MYDPDCVDFVLYSIDLIVAVVEIMIVVGAVNAIGFVVAPHGDLIVVVVNEIDNAVSALVAHSLEEFAVTMLVLPT